MAGSVNKVILVGNVGNDPEIRTFGNGGKVANLSLATSESWRDKQSGEKREKTEWHRVAVFGEGLVGVIERYVKKGSKLYIEGKLQTRKWQDRDGNNRYSTEVVADNMGPRKPKAGHQSRYVVAERGEVVASIWGGPTRGIAA